MNAAANAVRPPVRLEFETVGATTGLLLKAAGGVLEAYSPAPHLVASQSDLEEILTDAAQALRTVIAWIPRPDVETLELDAALQGYLS